VLATTGNLRKGGAKIEVIIGVFNMLISFLIQIRPLHLTNPLAPLSKSPDYPRTYKWKWNALPLSKLLDHFV
jgi:hypothetical protein